MVSSSWADAFDLHIILAYQKGANPGSALLISPLHVRYSNSEELIDGLDARLREIVAESILGHPAFR
ncbi:MAG: hypothetical protein ACE5DM_03595 [Candidatus Nanoarchaeia archaeon]